MKSLKFATIDENATYPRVVHDGDDDQSYGFTQAFKLQSGNTRGVQTVGYGGSKIDGANNRITITNSNDGTLVGLGNIPGTTKFGFFAVNKAGQLLYTNINGTQTFYNPVNNYTPELLVGGAPDDGRTGVWVTKPGENVITRLGG